MRPASLFIRSCAGLLAFLAAVLPAGCTGTKTPPPALLQPSKKEVPADWRPRDLKPNYLALARDLLKQKQYAVAIRQLSLVRKEDKNKPELHYLLGVCHRETGDLTAAQADFRRAADLDPEYAPAYNGLGITLFKLKEERPACEAFKKAAALDPAGADFQNNLGVAEMRLGNSEAARSRFQQCLRLDPRHVRAKNNLAECLLKMGQEAAAFLFLKRHFPLAAACNNMGGLHLAAGHPEKARQMFRRALEHDPNLAEAKRNLSRLEKTAEE